MKRRDFISLLGGAAQQGERVRRVGVLMNLAVGDPEGEARSAAFLQALQQLGWSDGRNVRIDYRWAAGDAGRFHRYAEELLALVPDVILAAATPSVAGDPHGAYRVRDCRRPGRRGFRR
jgi:putative tryptophan/tyrosine transport system substrate-binding protein